ncbi:hypothetical protein QC761_202740 [Podospora bellae-mahoneyi]|uniref:HTH TFE/IIEalpha-type domain-containing protein n=1 Tax=Podospora bellae-mahoneyi TaxID=2093777 RepID=A0ABR0FPC5_9PEZI|nr:hypothetical protein QC761_202740 [Podospora bellae-mahoneyi]
MSDSHSLAQILIRSVIRAFHTTQEVLAIEALVQHSCLRDDELAYLMKMNTKDLHRLCASLRDARFLTVHTRPEVIEGKTRPVNRTYYYIDYQQTVDAIKWRVYKTDKDMQGIAKPQDESKEYSCPRCKSQWTQLEVLDSVSIEGFLCLRCEAVLERSQEQEQPGHQQLSRMNNQFKFMTDMLQQIDKGLVPECSFDKAIAVARPIVREAMHEVLASVPVEDAGGMGKPSAVKGLANTGPKTMQVTISDGNEEAELIESRKRKERFLRENALPSWITDSSVPAPAATAAPPVVSFEMRDADGGDGGRAGKRVKVEGDMSFKMEEDEEDDLEFEDVV